MSVVAQHSPELRLASTSPFPSPGSPFYPPPRLEPHESASRPSSSRTLLNGTNNARESARNDNDTTAMPHADSDRCHTFFVRHHHCCVPNDAHAGLVKTPTTQITVPHPLPKSDAPHHDGDVHAPALAALAALQNPRGLPEFDDRHVCKAPEPRVNYPRRRWSTYSAASVSYGMLTGPAPKNEFSVSPDAQRFGDG